MRENREKQESKIEIIVKQGTEYQAREEDIYMPNIFFRQSYKQAINCVEDILQVAESYQQDACSGVSDLELHDWLMGYPNNVIAFCAERGQGKTSAMVSFAHALSRLSDKKEQAKWRESYAGDAAAPDYRFEVLNSVDPSSMLDQHSILQVILSRMLSCFQNKWELQNNSNTLWMQEERHHSQRRTILQYLQRCYQSLQITKEDLLGDDVLEKMMELGESGNVRGALYRLICAFLDFMQGTDKSYLVLQIDDADLSLGDTFQLIDQIRRNLVMPRVIVLLAANMFQLESTVEQHFIGQYAKSIQARGMVTKETCHSIAARYMDKVIPSARQIYLPDLSKLLARKFDDILVRYEKRENGEENLLGEGRELHYQNQLLRLVHRRTGLVLLDPKNHLHNLLPGNMRELVHFLPYFQKMDPLTIDYMDLIRPVTEDKRPDLMKRIDTWLNNLEQFKVYLMDIWAAVNLRTEGRQFLRGMHQYGDANLHRYLLDFLPDYYTGERIYFGNITGNMAGHNEELRQQFIGRCKQRGLQYYTDQEGERYASYADAMEALGVLAKLPDATRQYKFIYAVRLYYTIRMHELMLEEFREKLERNSDKLDGLENKYCTRLTEFLGDVLWRREEFQDIRLGIRSGHYTLKGKALAQSMERLLSEGNPNQQSSRHASFFCRELTLQHGFYCAVPMRLEEFQNTDRDINLSFNLFYPCVRDLEILLRRGNAETEKALEDKTMQDKILGSMILLLNWDVQYMLARDLLDGIEQGNLGGALLPALLRGIYSGSAMQKVIRAVREATCWKVDADLFRWYCRKDSIEGPGGEKTDFDERILYAIQFSIPELKECWATDCGTKIDAIMKQTDTLKVLDFQSDDTVSTLYRRVNSSEIQDEKAVGAVIELWRRVQSAGASIEIFIKLEKPEAVGNGLSADMTISELNKQLKEWKTIVDTVVDEANRQKKIDRENAQEFPDSQKGDRKEIEIQISVPVRVIHTNRRSKSYCRPRKPRTD